MARVADPLREYVERMGWGGMDELLAIADEIDAEHDRRMWSCEYEVRKRLCRDMRWAVSMFERQRGRRQTRAAIEDGELDYD